MLFFRTAKQTTSKRLPSRPTSMLKHLFFRNKYFFRTPKYPELLALSNNFFLVITIFSIFFINPFSAKLLLWRSYFFRILRKLGKVQEKPNKKKKNKRYKSYHQVSKRPEFRSLSVQSQRGQSSGAQSSSVQSPRVQSLIVKSPRVQCPNIQSVCVQIPAFSICLQKYMQFLYNDCRLILNQIHIEHLLLH